MRRDDGDCRFLRRNVTGAPGSGAGRTGRAWLYALQEAGPGARLETSTDGWPYQFGRWDYRLANMSRVSGAHDDLVREQFRAQAVTFTDDGFATRGLEWIVGQLAPASGELVLDVAAGTAHLGRVLAPRVAHVSAVDLTPEMLRQGRRLAAAQGLRNVAFLVGDATALPWAAQHFDLVVCRLALHQLADPAAVVREMLRVIARGLSACPAPVAAAASHA